MGGGRDRRAARGGQPALQFVGEHEVGELGLAVPGDPPVAVLGLEVVEVDPPLPVIVAADGHHPGPGPPGHPVEQQPAQREMAQVVDAELQLEAVGGDPVRRHHDPGVVDQQVDALAGGPDLCGRRADRPQRGQIQRHHPDIGSRRRGTDPGDRVVCLALVPAAEEQPRAPLREHPRRLEADAGVAPGDHSRAPGLIRHIRLGPRGRRVAHPGLLAHPATRLSARPHRFPPGRTGSLRPHRFPPAATVAAAAAATADVNGAYNVSHISSGAPASPARRTLEDCVTCSPTRRPGPRAAPPAGP